MKKADIGILIALKEEFRVFMDEFGDIPYKKDKDTGRYYYFFEWPEETGGYHCAATFVGDMGPEAAALATHAFMKNWEPATIAMLGIAGGMHEDVGIGDVIFADQVDAYSVSGKVSDLKNQLDVQLAGEVFRFPFDLMQDIDNMEFAGKSAFEQWQNDCRLDLKGILKPGQIKALVKSNILKETVELQKGHIASGPYVVTSEIFKNRLKVRDRSFKAVEMEAAGLMKAVYQKIEPPKSLILRGISDHGNADKKNMDGIGKGALRQYAMRNTIRLLKILLELGLLPKHEILQKKSESVKSPSDPQISGASPGSMNTPETDAGPDLADLKNRVAEIDRFFINAHYDLAYVKFHELCGFDPSFKNLAKAILIRHHHQENQRILGIHLTESVAEISSSFQSLLRRFKQEHKLERF